MENPRFVLELFFNNSRAVAELPVLFDSSLYSKLFLSDNEAYDSFVLALLRLEEPIGCFVVEEGRLGFESSPLCPIETSFDPSLSSLIIWLEDDALVFKALVHRYEERFDLDLVNWTFVEQMKLFSKGQLKQGVDLADEELENLRDNMPSENPNEDVEELLHSLIAPKLSERDPGAQRRPSEPGEPRTEKKSLGRRQVLPFRTPEKRPLFQKQLRLCHDDFPSSSESQNSDHCSICFNPYNIVKATLSSCSHIFCYECILEWSKITNRCPLCKIPFLTINRGKRKIKVLPREQSRADQLNFFPLIESISENNCYCCSLTSFVSNPLLVCEHCNIKTCHMLCLDPPLTFISAEPWFCDFCVGEHQIPNVLPIANTTQLVPDAVIKKRLRLLHQTINGDPAELGLGIDGEPLKVQRRRSRAEISPPQNRIRQRKLRSTSRRSNGG